MGDGGLAPGTLASALVGDGSLGHAPLNGEIERADTGHVISNPISGERIVIRQSGAQTGGQLLVFDLFLPPGGHVPARHVHPIQEEHFTIVAGQMRFRLGFRSIVAGPGETVRIPPRKAHWFGNAGAVVSHACVEVRPALRMEELFESSETISQAASVRGARLPHPADLARFLLQFQREVAIPNAPAFLVRAALTPLAWLGERRAKSRGQHGPG